VLVSEELEEDKLPETSCVSRSVSFSLGLPRPPRKSAKRIECDGRVFRLQERGGYEPGQENNIKPKL